MKKDIERFVERAKKDLLSWLKRPSSKNQSITLNVLIKEEDDILVAHCLELDIVATADSLKQVKEDISSLIIAQIDYAFSNNNLDHLFHPAPQEIWSEFHSLKKKAIKERHKMEPFFQKNVSSIPPPPWIITNTCQAPRLCHA